MGSFNVACRISGLTIHPGDKAVLLPLAYTWPGELFENRVRSHSTITNDGPMAFCYPFALPVKGVYADYGEIEPEQESLEVFVKSVGVTLDDFSEILRGDKDVPNNWPSVCATWIHGDIWKRIIESKPFQVGNAWPLGMYTLECLGFEFAQEVKVERYTKLYLHPSSEEFGVVTDGAFSYLVKMTELPKYRQLCHAPDKFATLWYKLTGSHLTIPDISQAQHTIEKYIKHGHPVNILIKDYRLTDLAWRLPVAPQTVEWNLLSLFADKLEQIKSELSELSTIIQYLYYVNVLLVPSYCGTQHGDDEKSLQLAQWTTVIAQGAHEEYLKMWKE